MAPPVNSVGPTGAPRRARRHGAAGAADPAAAAESPSAAEPAAPVPPAAARHGDALSAHLIGQADPAENAGPANSTRHAHSTYLTVEWSGPRDRRTRRGRIAKTDI